VNNCAAGENFAGGRPAPARSQSQSPHPKRVIGRLLAEPEALAPTSNRKRPQEGHYISAVDGRAKRRKSQQQQQKTMNDSQQWQQHRAFGALDWASEKHSVIASDKMGSYSTRASKRCGSTFDFIERQVDAECLVIALL
jgi:hypothetical protein